MWRRHHGDLLAAGQVSPPHRPRITTSFLRDSFSITRVHWGFPVYSNVFIKGEDGVERGSETQGMFL